MQNYIFVFFMLLGLGFPKEVFADKICARVVAKNGLNVRNSPNLNGKKIHKLAFGDSFAYYSDGATGIYESVSDGAQKLKGEWVKIILHPKFSEEYEDETYGYVFYTAKYAEEIDCNEFRHRLYSIDLYVNAYDDESVLLDSLRGVLQLEFVDQDLFQQFKAKQISKIEKDSTQFHVEKDSLYLQLENGETKKIISYPWGKNGDEDFKETYEYIGYIASLKQYLIQGSYWETGDYKFFDYTTGKKTQHFHGYPNLSPQNKFLLCLEGNGNYNDESDLQLFSIKNGEIKAIFSYSFGNWIYEDELVWISDQEAIIKVSSSLANYPIQAYVEEDKNIIPDQENKKIQFIKIKILK